MDRDEKQQPHDLSEKGSQRRDEESAELAQQLESDDYAPTEAGSTIDEPKADSLGENKVSTSLDEE